jgi:hypothetical protein
LQTFYAATAAFYGADSDKALAAQRQVIAEERAYQEAQYAESLRASKALQSAEDARVRSVLKGYTDQIDANQRYLEGLVKDQKALEDLANYAQELDTRVTQQHAKALQEMTALNDKITKEQEQQWKWLTSSISSSFTSAITSMVKGTQTLGDAVRSIFSSLFDSVVKELVDWVTQWVTQHIIAMTVTKTTAAGQIPANAAVAATAAMASVAAIPFIGWAMAPEVGAATFGEAMAYEASVAAEQGYDVPSGVNPIAQLHQREMVLPAPIADTFRNAAANTGGGGGGAQVQFIPVGRNHGLVEMSNLAAAIKGLNNRFALS